MGQIAFMNVFGLDIGGSGIKGAPVDLDRGELIGERQRLETPPGATIKDVAATVTTLIAMFDPKPELVGAAFPAVIVDGHARSAANIDKGWIDADVADILGDAVGVTVHPINDADAAGLAEMRFGVGRDVKGTVLMLTLGTGIGSALFLDGALVPNTELGHLEVDGHDAETKAADSARDREELTWEHWAKRLSRYFSHLEALLWPDLIILGGGVSKKADKFVPLLTGVRTPVVPAKLQNEAGIIGAGLWAREQTATKRSK
jgi:polyphosphate glucokinase